MSTLRRVGEDPPVDLRVTHLIGRSSACHLRLHEPGVSAIHASLRWSAEGWELRDLGSRNGTWLNGRRLGPGEGARVCAGNDLGFGGPQAPWRLITDTAPPARAFPSDGGAPAVERGGTLALPDRSAPEILIFRDEDGGWWAEGDGQSCLATDLRQLAAGGRTWELDLPDLDRRTPITAPVSGGGARLRLRFQVSRDEEHVTLTARAAEGDVPMGARAHHYLLLTLARRRLADAADAPGDTGAHGWIGVEELMRMFRVEETQLNLQIFRIRRQFAEAGFDAPAAVIERRRGTGQVRIGVLDLEIERA